jgi:cystathionine gamma-lyase
MLENAVAALENAKYGLAFASGMAAINNILNLLKSGDHIVAGLDLYGGAYRIFTKLYSKYGLEFSFIDQTDLNEVEKALKPNTRIVWVESPSNPLLNIVDIAAVSKSVKERGVLVLVDNTFATPCLQKPLEMGADIALHSTTKYINGHLDVINGALATNDRELWEQLKFFQNTVGSIPGPQDCYLVLRGLATLELRMEKHCSNARKIVDFLKEDPRINHVYYPGLPERPGYNIAARQMKNFGGMVSFELDAGIDESKEFLKNLKYFTLAESLGGVRSLICHPPSMTHASVEPEVRRKAGITDGLIRASVGIESPDDLIEDLEQALNKVFQVKAGAK